MSSTVFLLALLISAVVLIEGQTTTVAPTVDDKSSCEIIDDTSSGEFGACTATVMPSSDVQKSINDLATLVQGSETGDGLVAFRAAEPDASAAGSRARGRPVGPLPIVDWCPEQCRSRKPSSVWINGQLWGVVQSIPQYYTECKCIRRSCSGKVAVKTRRRERRQRPAVWRGVCVQGFGWVRLLVYRTLNVKPPVSILRYRFIKVCRDCCCSPFRFRPIRG